jgi:hypothetical protein
VNEILHTGWWSIPGSGYKTIPGVAFPYEDFIFCLSVAEASKAVRRRTAGLGDTRFVR